MPDPPRDSPVAGVSAVLGGILVPSGLVVGAWTLLSKPIALKFLVLAVLLVAVGAGFIAYASELDREG